MPSRLAFPTISHRGGPSPAAGVREGPALCILTLGALVLRAVHVTRFELWVDEAATWHFARLASAGRLLEQFSLEPNPPLYFALIGVFTRILGDSDLVLRLPSILAGAAAVPAVYALGRLVLSRRAGFIAAVLVAVHPLHVFYSREARVYPFLLLAAVLVWFFLRKAMDEDRRRWWLLFGGVLLAACYSHFYGLFLVATAAVMLLAWSPNRSVLRRGFAVVALVGLAFVPYLLLSLPHLREGGAWWIEALYEKYPQEKRFGRAVEMGLLGADYNPLLREIARPPTPPGVRWPSLLAQGALLVAALAGARRRDRTADFAFLLVAWLLPLVLPWTLNTWRAVYHTGRHDFYVLGALAVLLAAGIEEILDRFRRAGGGRRWVCGALAAFVVVVLSVAAGHRLFELHRLEPTDYSRRAGAWIARHGAAEDRVVALGLRRLRTEHYARRAGSGAAFESFPRSTDGHPGWTNVDQLLEDEEALRREARGRLAALRDEAAEGATLFVLLRSYRRTATAVSAEWLVDRHLLENLAAAGWRPAPGLENQELAIAAFRPPSSG